MSIWSLRMRKAFTLVELAMVLVIFGFISIMMFKGKALYDSSKIRAGVKSVEKMRTALGTKANTYDDPAIELKSDSDTGGEYDLRALFVTGTQPLLTDGDISVYKQPNAIWGLFNCSKANEGQATHNINTDYSSSYICIITNKVAFRFGCFLDKILDDDNATRGYARNGSGTHFENCSQASDSTTTNLHYIIY